MRLHHKAPAWTPGLRSTRNRSGDSLDTARVRTPEAKKEYSQTEQDSCICSRKNTDRANEHQQKIYIAIMGRAFEENKKTNDEEPGWAQASQKSVSSPGEAAESAC